MQLDQVHYLMEEAPCGHLSHLQRSMLFTYPLVTCLQVRKRALWEAKRDLNYGLNGQVATSSDGRETSEARRMTQADAIAIHGTQQQVTRW